jgi:hypothetical protein
MTVLFRFQVTRKNESLAGHGSIMKATRTNEGMQARKDLRHGGMASSLEVFKSNTRG